MNWKIIFLGLWTVSYSEKFENTNWNLLIFIGNASDPALHETQKLKLSNSFTAPHILYVFNESELNLLSPLKRPFYFKSRNQINSYIVLDKLENISLVSGNLERILTPKNYPIVFKDEEKVAFHVINWTEDEIRSILKSFGKCLKYKLVFSYNNQLVELKNPAIFSSCEFCKPKDDIIPSKEEWNDYESNFGGSTLRITTPASARPRLNYTLGSNGKYRMVSGLLMYLVLYMQDSMNFTIDVKPAGRGGGTGIQLPNGTWTGIMSEVLSGEVDIGMCTAETYIRSLISGFTPAVMMEPVIFVSGPPHKIFVWKAIFWPFRSEVWSFLAGIILVSVVMIQFSYAVLNVPRKKRWASNKALGFILGILLGNSGKTPSYLPFTVKVYVVIWLLCGSIITTAYLSKLVGFLTFPQLEKVPETPEELVESQYRWGLTYFGGVLYTLIKGSKLKVYEEVLSKMELRPDIIGCLSQTLEKKYICISYEIISRFYLNSRTDIKQNPFTYSKNTFVTIPVGIVMEKRAVFGPNLKSAVRSSDTSGLYSFWEKLDFRKVRQSILAKKKRDRKVNLEKPDEQQSNEEDNRSLTLPHMRGAFTIFFTGLILAWTVFIFEKIIRLTARQA